jgi:shikimate kinase
VVLLRGFLPGNIFFRHWVFQEMLSHNKCRKLVLIGFMGAGKSSVARELASIFCCKQLDLDEFIAGHEKMPVSGILEQKGEVYFRKIETHYLKKALESGVEIISLGGGAWTIEENRKLIKGFGYTTLWLDSTFEQCWNNIQGSKQIRPLAKDRKTAEKLFFERRKFYVLADFHFFIKPHTTPYEIASSIVNELNL